MEYDECKKCPGYCCYHHDSVATPLTNEDINRIAKHVNVPVGQFIEDFVTINKGLRRWVYDDSPNAVGHFKKDEPHCVFLKNGLCEINSVKPRACRDMRPKHIGNGVTCVDFHKVWLGVK